MTKKKQTKKQTPLEKAAKKYVDSLPYYSYTGTATDGFRAGALWLARRLKARVRRDYHGSSKFVTALVDLALKGEG